MGEIQYEFDQKPEQGEFLEILPGINWLRMPLPMALNSINLWVIRDGDGWTIVDTGLGLEQSEGVWQNTLDNLVKDDPVHRVIVTHMHPDHAGMAGWLCRKFQATLWMTRAEYLMCRLLAADTGPAPEEGSSFYRGAGFAEDRIEKYQKRFGMFGSVIRPMPVGYRRLMAEETFRIGEHTWRVVMGSGHSPEHACLFCEERNLIISGDQILPTISSNVSVWPTEPDGNPLKFWLDSCARLRDSLPEDVLVLPAHGKPFRGARTRLQNLIDEHHQGLDKLLTLCQEPKRAVDVFPALFKSEIKDGNFIMA
ncbi:MAG: MBL fold metallo-hydrolase, partial [Pseudomonadota bacterium]